MTKEYYILIKTNCYAGNFEREMCAYLTGHTGECEVGEELVEENIKDRFGDKISSKPDDYGCYRPVELDSNTNNFIIFLDNILPTKDVEFIHNRAKKFELERPYEYLDSNFRYLGIELIEKEITEKNNIIYNYNNDN